MLMKKLSKLSINLCINSKPQLALSLVLGLASLVVLAVTPTHLQKQSLSSSQVSKIYIQSVTTPRVHLYHRLRQRQFTVSSQVRKIQNRYSIALSSDPLAGLAIINLVILVIDYQNNRPLYKVLQTYDNDGGNGRSLVHNNWPSTGHQDSDHVSGGFLNEALKARAELPT
ncbi:hypothetical protein PV328_004003 [Microctonus aethiopoides]|uniref:Uncharacterized protein n=1 Tax=Microctonus aethiopoides TaxID=144406 RepID=A0AA39F9U0_9HYME|nr:hypothetical protein PV328_004003 [Microctonus aethiopoides]